MIKRGKMRLNMQRGASVTEFKEFLDDLELAYLAVYELPNQKTWQNLERRFRFPLELMDPSFFMQRLIGADRLHSADVFPPDKLEITRISIQSPGWIELLASLNPLQQLREYLTDRHERKKDKEWRWESEKQRAIAELDILRIQAERERTGAIKEFCDLLDQMDIHPDEKQRIVWERVGAPLARLARHQDSGLLGSQNDNIDGHKESVR